MSQSNSKQAKTSKKENQHEPIRPKTTQNKPKRSIEQHKTSQNDPKQLKISQKET